MKSLPPVSISIHKHILCNLTGLKNQLADDANGLDGINHTQLKRLENGSKPPIFQTRPKNSSIY